MCVFFGGVGVFGVFCGGLGWFWVFWGGLGCFGVIRWTVQKVYLQILACTPKCQSLGIHVPPNENVCGHADLAEVASSSANPAILLLLILFLMF